VGFHVIHNNAAAPNSDEYLQEKKHTMPDNPRSNEHSFFLSTHKTQQNPILQEELSCARSSPAGGEGAANTSNAMGHN
jgi:uncharacterized short protein YbdD (DUF466 family)